MLVVHFFPGIWIGCLKNMAYLDVIKFGLNLVLESIFKNLIRGPVFIIIIFVYFILEDSKFYKVFHNIQAAHLVCV
jgi:hypothetical protein